MIPIISLAGPIKKGSSAWCRDFDIKETDIIDYEGWKDKGWKEPITEREFSQRIANSTVRECNGRNRVMVRMSALLRRQEKKDTPHERRTTVHHHKKDMWSSKEMTIRYIQSLESRNRRLERRELLWIVLILGSIGVNVGQYVGLLA